VYACFGIFISCLPKVTTILGHPWQTKFRGKLNVGKIRATISLHREGSKRRANYKHILLQQPLARTERSFTALQSVACVKKADTCGSPHA
jgi:hypothetical protein